MAAVAYVGAVVGALIGLHIPKSAFYPIILVLLIAVGAYTLFKPSLGESTVLRFSGHRHTVFAMLTGFVIGVYDGALGPGTGSFLVFALVGLMGYAFLEASAKAKIANFATNLGALTVFIPGGHVMWVVGGVMAVANLARRLRRRPHCGGQGQQVRARRVHRRRRRLHRADRRRPPRRLVTSHLSRTWVMTVGWATVITHVRGSGAAEDASAHLLHERHLVHPKADEVDAQHAVVTEHDLVLAQVVIADGEPDPVTCPVDLDHEPAALPPRVEVDPPEGGAAQHLAIGRRDAVPTTHRGEVQLTERLGAVGDVTQHLSHEGPAPAVAHDWQRLQQPSAGRQALLHHQAQDRALPGGRSSPRQRPGARRPPPACAGGRCRPSPRLVG